MTLMTMTEQHAVTVAGPNINEDTGMNFTGKTEFVFKYHGS